MKSESFLLQRHQHQRHQRHLHLRSPAADCCSTRPSWGQTSRCASSDARHGNHTEASCGCRQQHAQLARSSSRSPARASKPCQIQRPQQVGLILRSLCRAACSTSASSKVTMHGRSCSRQLGSQMGLCQQHELHSQLPGWSRLGKCHTRPAPCCRPTRTHLPLIRTHYSSSSGCGQRTWNSLLYVRT